MGLITGQENKIPHAMGYAPPQKKIQEPEAEFQGQLKHTEGKNQIRPLTYQISYSLEVTPNQQGLQSNFALDYSIQLVVWNCQANAISWLL